MRRVFAQPEWDIEQLLSQPGETTCLVMGEHFLKAPTGLRQYASEPVEAAQISPSSGGSSEHGPELSFDESEPNSRLSPSGLSSSDMAVAPPSPTSQRQADWGHRTMFMPNDKISDMGNQSIQPDFIPPCINPTATIMYTGDSTSQR